MLNLSSLSTQSLASCVNYFVWNCLTCFSNTKIGSVTSFSILFNFQGPVCASALRLTAWLFYHRSDFLSSSFFEVFRFLSNLERSQFLGAGRNFRTSIGSFRFTSSWDSEVILLSQRLALKYNTIRRAGCQHFFASFFRFFRADSNPLHPLGFFRQSLLSFIMYYIKEHSIDNGLYYPAESTTSFVQIVKRFRLKFCSGNFPLFLVKATKHKM